MENLKHKSNTLRLTESAVMIALGTVLSMLTLVALPTGGSITPFSMLPLIIVAYRYGTKWGLITSAAYGFLQMLLGMDNLKYAATFLSLVCIILFDYIIAFIMLGLGGIFRNKFKGMQSTELLCGVIVAGVGRYICHFISGWAIWGIWAPEGTPAWLYSLSYNASYMVPEIVITAAGAVLISSVLSFQSREITTIRAGAEKLEPKSIALKILGAVFCVAAILFDPLILFFNKEAATELILLLVPVILVILGIILILLSKFIDNNKKTQ